MVAGGGQGGMVKGTTDAILADVMVELAGSLGTGFSIQKVLDRLVARIVDILPVTGAGVMLWASEGQEPYFVAASDEVVMRIEGLQSESGEGPSLEAYRSGERVAVPDLQLDTRFPVFSPRASAEGLAAVFTFPLRREDDRLGALDLYRDVPGALTEQALRGAQVLADIAAAYLSSAKARVHASATVARLNHRGLHDPLTGLPNRTLLEDLLEQAVARAGRFGHAAAVLFVDLDGFRSVNERYGHHVGDELLIAVAVRLTQALRPGDALGRLGSDEFVVLCEDLRDPVQSEAVAKRLIAALGEPFDITGQRIELSASVGIALSGSGRTTPAALLQDGDFALHQAKKNGSGRYEVIDPAARAAAGQRDDLERDLQQAQRRDQLSLMYQPVILLPGGELAGVEALLRWHHPERGWVPPTMTIGLAERTGLILPLGEWVLRQACQDLASWRGQGLTIPSLAVNVSAHQVMAPAFARTVERILNDTDADPTALTLEVTESVFLTDAPRALAVMGQISDHGVVLALDDFGTGYSSLSYLRHFPVDVVKIDRSFTADLLSDKATGSIFRAIIELGHALDLSVTAEGVETARQLAEVTALGADRAQGFHLSRPLSPSALSEYVTNRTAGV